MSHHHFDQQGPEFPLPDDALRAAADVVEQLVLELEPLARDLNRLLTDAFGRHPSSVDGTWTFINHGDDDSFTIGLESIPPRHVLAIGDVLRKAFNAAFDGGHAARLNLGKWCDLGPAIVGEAAALRAVPPVHVRVERR